LQQLNQGELVAGRKDIQEGSDERREDIKMNNCMRDMTRPQLPSLAEDIGEHASCIAEEATEAANELIEQGERPS
jgi:hypothetical protein